MKFLKYIKYSLLITVLFASCNANMKTEEKNSEHEHEEEAPTQTELTEEQIKSVGVKLGHLEMRNISSTEKINGVLRVPSSNKAVITAVFGGVIDVVKIHEGDYVKKGQVIATISNPEYINVQEQYLMVKNQINYAEQEFSRQQELFDNGAGAKKNLQNASTQLKDLKTQRASLIKRLQLMGINVGQLNDNKISNVLSITAPISGTISNVFAQVGSYVDVSSPVAEIIDNTAIHLDLQIFEKDIEKIKTGQIVDFTLTNVPNKSYQAKIDKIGSSFERDSKMISVHCMILGNKLGLIDGMSAVGIIHTSDNLEMTVPNSAIVDADGKSYIFIEFGPNERNHQHEEGKSHNHNKEDNSVKKTFEKIQVAKGASDLGYTAIVPVKELEENTIVVVEGAFFVNAKMSNTGGHEH